MVATVIDDSKSIAGASDIVPVMEAMTEHLSDADIQDAGCAALSRMALRSVGACRVCGGHVDQRQSESYTTPPRLRYVTSARDFTV